MRPSLLAAFIVLIGVVTASAGSPTPKEIVTGLMTVKGHYDNYTKPDQVKKIKGVLTPQLYSALLDWSIWLQKAYKAIPETDYDTKMIMPMSDNPFFGEGDQEGDPVPVERITGDTATVVAPSVYTESDGKTVIRKATNTFQFVKVKGNWLLSNVQRVRSSYPAWKPMEFNLLTTLKEETADYKKQVRKK